MRALLDWLDDRTGYRGLLRVALYERIPGGARWRYVWGSALTFAVAVQILTGIVLWTAYSPNAQGAWESVYYIQTQMLGGWLVRGIHHYTAQATVVLLALHLMQVVVDGAYRAPRELNFWLGLALLFLVLALSLTGYLLPWDQKGYWATRVATSIVSVTPLVGPQLQQLLVGGPEYGHLTLTRFFALHAGVLPGIVVVLIIGHLYLFRRHGVTVARGGDGPEGLFWPDQLLRDAVAGLAVMATVLALVLWRGGAELGPPADPTEPYAAARPEWYFLPLFQWLKHFPTGTEVVGAIVVPGALALLVALMPFVARWRLGHRFNISLLATVLVAIGVLMRQAVIEDRSDPDFVAARAKATTEAARVRELAASDLGIPPGGALALLRADPLMQGPRIFASACASCHRYDGHDGLGAQPTDEQSASDLKSYGSREWLSGLLDPERVTTATYFGASEHRRGRMARFVQRAIAGFDDNERAQLAKVVKALSFEARLPRQAALDDAEYPEIEEGRDAMASEPIDCVRCHLFRGVTEEDVGPHLDGWASRSWMLGLLSDPGDPDYYGEDNDRMPAFGEEGILTDQEMGLVVDWLREDWYGAGAALEVPR
jgi:ubiquinol-cytochrome c reductase cytochrome b subunit